MNSSEWRSTLVNRKTSINADEIWAIEVAQAFLRVGTTALESEGVLTIRAMDISVNPALNHIFFATKSVCRLNDKPVNIYMSFRVYKPADADFDRTEVLVRAAGAEFPGQTREFLGSMIPRKTSLPRPNSGSSLLKKDASGWSLQTNS